MRRASGIAILVILASALAARATATPLIVDGGWHVLDWDCAPGQIVASGQCGATPSDGFYQFTLLKPGVLTLTDMFTAGDEFDVTVSNGSPVTQSSSPVAPGDEAFQPCPDFTVEPCHSAFGGGADFQQNASYYFSSGHYSTLQWALAPGTYDVMFTLTKLAPDWNDKFPGDFQTAGLAAVRVDAVPEPASLVLLGTGLAGLAHRARRRKAS